MKTRRETREILDKLESQHPGADTELHYRTPFELLTATILSAQSTDAMVNTVTPALFKRYPNARALAKADVAEVERLIGTLGMYRQKSKRIVEMARLVCEEHGGKVPDRLEALVKLPGVGRKTANVLLGVWFGKPEGVVVDTHVQRIAQRLKWTRNTEPEKIEKDLCKILPRDRWAIASHILIFHGRRICFARKPACETCGINDVCPSAFRAEKVGRKPPRVVRLPTQ